VVSNILKFSPLPREMIRIDEHVFQMGWFNHQLVMEIRCLAGGLIFFNPTPGWLGKMIQFKAGQKSFHLKVKRGLEKCDVTAGHLQRSKIGLVVPWIVES